MWPSHQSTTGYVHLSLPRPAQELNDSTFTLPSACVNVPSTPTQHDSNSARSPFLCSHTLTVTAFCVGRRVCRLSVCQISRTRRDRRQIWSPTCRKSGSPSKNMTSDFAPEVANHPQQQFRECASLLFRFVSDAACLPARRYASVGISYHRLSVTRRYCIETAARIHSSFFCIQVSLYAATLCFREIGVLPKMRELCLKV